VTVNPLVVPAIDQPTDIWAGIWIAEDIELIVQGVKTNSWVDTTLGSVGAALDGLAFVSDPGGAVLQYLASWVMEHFKPLTDVLDWLAGNPGAIAGHAQTWRNVGTALHGQVTELTDALIADIGSWGGTAGPTYRAWAQLQHSAVEGLANACEAMATITECAGYVVGAVRIMVRDLIAIAFSRAVSYLAELGFSAGFATPLVVEQVTTLTLSTGGKIARLLRGLFDSLRRLFEAVPRLLRHIDELKQILGRLGERKLDDGLFRKVPDDGNGAKIDGPGEGSPGNLEGQKEISVADPGDPARTITDIDDVRSGVLWEEKSATWAGDEQKWVTKQVIQKLESYLEARQHLLGYENAPIGLRMTEPGVEPSLRAAIEAAIDEFRKAHPGVDVRLEFAS
jgi:uncharacterized protein YukE